MIDLRFTAYNEQSNLNVLNLLLCQKESTSGPTVITQTGLIQYKGKRLRVKNKSLWNAGFGGTLYFQDPWHTSCMLLRIAKPVKRVRSEQ